MRQAAGPVACMSRHGPPVPVLAAAPRRPRPQPSVPRGPETLTSGVRWPAGGRRCSGSAWDARCHLGSLLFALDTAVRSGPVQGQAKSAMLLQSPEPCSSHPSPAGFDGSRFSVHPPAGEWATILASQRQGFSLTALVSTCSLRQRLGLFPLGTGCSSSPGGRGVMGRARAGQMRTQVAAASAAIAYRPYLANMSHLRTLHRRGHALPCVARGRTWPLPSPPLALQMAAGPVRGSTFMRAFKLRSGRDFVKAWLEPTGRDRPGRWRIVAAANNRPVTGNWRLLSGTTLQFVPGALGVHGRLIVDAGRHRACAEIGRAHV